MNKLSIAVKSIVIAMGMVGIAYADNNSWTGFYAGMDAGVIFNNAYLKSQQLGFTSPNENCNTSSDFSSFFPGIQLGFMHQFPNTLVTGIEANVTFNTHQKDALNCSCATDLDVYDRFTFRNQMQSSIKGRMGLALNWNNNILLPYLTAGASLSHVGLTYKNEGGDYYSDKNSQAGWLIGAGLEWAFRQNWSLRAEYYYANYGNAINLKIPSVYGLMDPNGKARVNLSSNNVAVAINYWM